MVTNSSHALGESWFGNSLNWEFWSFWWKSNSLVGWKATITRKNYWRIHWKERKDKSDCKSSEMGRTTTSEITSNWCGNIPKNGKILLQKSGWDKIDVKEKCLTPLRESRNPRHENKITYAIRNKIQTILII